MSLKCLFGHNLKEIGRHAISVYGSDREIPRDFETTFLSKCRNCGHLQVKTLKGFFPVKSLDDDDDDDDKGGDRDPILSPDDYFDLIEKK